jgi:hypothetical protein
MPSWPALRFFILVVSIPSHQAGSPADEGVAAAAAQRPMLGVGHTGTAARQEGCIHDHASRLSHFFVVPAGASAEEGLVNCPKTTSITGVPNFPGLS